MALSIQAICSFATLCGSTWTTAATLYQTSIPSSPERTRSLIFRLISSSGKEANVLKPTSVGVGSSKPEWLHRRYDDNRLPGFRTIHVEKANRAAPPSKRDEFALSLDHLVGEREAPQFFLCPSARCFPSRPNAARRSQERKITLSTSASLGSLSSGSAGWAMRAHRVRVVHGPKAVSSTSHSRPVA